MAAAMRIIVCFVVSDAADTPGCNYSANVKVMLGVLCLWHTNTDFALVKFRPKLKILLDSLTHQTCLKNRHWVEVAGFG
jgi:hypothetical protein